MKQAFSFSRLPEIHFGAGKFNELGSIVQRFGPRLLAITGKSSLENSGQLKALLGSCADRGITAFCSQAAQEPSPALIDSIVAQHRDNKIGVVASIGGGSAIDTGKAVSAMLRADGPVRDYLEGIGTKVHSGTKVPFIAVPTTAGTGSEATKNSVISQVGPDGFKKSLRHDNFMPDIALVDPALTLSCPPATTSACAMDALSQLLESYVSTQATPFTDSLALPALKCIFHAIKPVCTDSAGDISMRGEMAYAALVSGITLANAGLGVVHGLAGPLGAYFDIPHGVTCGTLCAPAMKITIERLRAADDRAALNKFAGAAALIGAFQNSDTNEACDLLIDWLYGLTELLGIARLGAYGIQSKHLDLIIARASNKNNPAKLDADDMRRLLEERL